MVKRHKDFKVTETGFEISLEKPEFGASPDGLVTCSCCGSGCLEIKSPYRLGLGAKLIDLVKLKDFCLQRGEKIFLDPTHEYYYQVQFQMFCLEKKYCDFVVWGQRLFL